MQLIQKWWKDGIGKPPVETVVCEVSDIVLRSRAATRCLLATHAGRMFGHREGRDWRIVQDPASYLVPFHACDSTGDRCLVIE